MARPKTKKLTPSAKLRKRLKAAQGGAAAGSMTLRIRLTGALADAWHSLREAAEGLDLTDEDLQGYLMIGTVGKIRSLLRLKQREVQP